MSTGLIVVLVIVGIISIIALWFILTYNGLTVAYSRVEEAFSHMDIYLKKRFDLIPNLVETTKDEELDDVTIFDINIDTVSENIFDDNKLVEINDSKVISHVNSLIPGLIQTGISVRNLVNSTRDVYRVVFTCRSKVSQF